MYAHLNSNMDSHTVVGPGQSPFPSGEEGVEYSSLDGGHLPEHLDHGRSVLRDIRCWKKEGGRQQGTS